MYIPMYTGDGPCAPHRAEEACALLSAMHQGHGRGAHTSRRAPQDCDECAGYAGRWIASGLLH